jgi:hypothetical protein
MPESFALVNVGNVHFNHRRADGTYAIGERNAGVGVGSGVKHDAIALKSHGLQLVDKFTLDVALKVIYLYIGEASTQTGQEIVERRGTINAWFAHAKQVEVGPVDNLYRHVSFILYFCSQNYE